MLLELHTTATDYFCYLLADGASWNDATARKLRNRTVELANRAGVTGQAFVKFTARVAAQVATAR